MTQPEDLKALVAELREHVRYRYMPASARVAMGRAADALEARIAVPEGWKLVPIEPTREMWAASGNAVNRFGHRLKAHHDRYSDAVWKAMLAAAPGVGGGG